jgi:hypothetical protein
MGKMKTILLLVMRILLLGLALSGTSCSRDEQEEQIQQAVAQEIKRVDALIATRTAADKARKTETLPAYDAQQREAATGSHAAKPREP